MIIDNRVNRTRIRFMAEALNASIFKLVPSVRGISSCSFSASSAWCVLCEGRSVFLGMQLQWPPFSNSPNLRRPRKGLQPDKPTGQTDDEQPQSLHGQPGRRDRVTHSGHLGPHPARDSFLKSGSGT